MKAATEEALEASRAKGSFLAMMSHAIRTPMNAILNMTGLALEAELPPKAKQYGCRAKRPPSSPASATT